jgi:hypothetical protein
MGVVPSMCGLEGRYTAKPDEVFINRLHVHYAFAVVSEQLTKKRADPDFIDVECLQSLCRLAEAETRSPGEKTCSSMDSHGRRFQNQFKCVVCTWGVSTSLASAIRKAARTKNTAGRRNDEVSVFLPDGFLSGLVISADGRLYT